jgi:uncharacterized protein YbjT (DUF2867 family)
MKILVVGATGNQGGAVVDHLLSGDYGTHELYGLTRTLHDQRVQRLAARGVHMVEGDLTDRARLEALVQGVDAVFGVTTPFERGVDAEREQGFALVEACANAGVSHLVFSSVAGADRETGIPHFESKFAIERRLRESDVSATVLRPVYFVQNFEYGLAADIRDERRLEMPLREGVSLDLLDVSDLGRYAAAAFDDPARFAGETIALAGDSRTLDSMAEVFSDFLGQAVTPIHLRMETYRSVAGPDRSAMYEWFNEEGYDVDPSALEATYGIGLRTLPEYLATSPFWRASRKQPS